MENNPMMLEAIVIGGDSEAMTITGFETINGEELI
jgi:hypothetical protein